MGSAMGYEAMSWFDKTCFVQTVDSIDDYDQ